MTLIRVARAAPEVCVPESPDFREIRRGNGIHQLLALGAVPRCGKLFSPVPASARSVLE